MSKCESTPIFNKVNWRVESGDKLFSRLDREAKQFFEDKRDTVEIVMTGFTPAVAPLMKHRGSVPLKLYHFDTKNKEYKIQNII